VTAIVSLHDCMCDSDCIAADACGTDCACYRSRLLVKPSSRALCLRYQDIASEAVSMASIPGDLVYLSLALQRLYRWLCSDFIAGKIQRLHRWLCSDCIAGNLQRLYRCICSDLIAAKQIMLSRCQLSPSSHVKRGRMC
jgi:hypothetical protein